MQVRKYIVIGLVGASLLSACGEYQKALKSDDATVKYNMAEQLYKEGKYKKSIQLFKDIMDQYAGRPQGERVVYMAADAYYKTKQYTTASYQFERFCKLYPKSEKVAEAAFLAAKTIYLETPKYSVDQEVTHQALEKLQLFLDRYSHTEYAKEANEMTLDLLTRLQKKEFEIAKQYNLIRDYQAAMKALDNFLSSNPGTVFKEEALFVRLHSAYEWAINSVEHKKEERLKIAKEAYETLVKSYPETSYKKEADKMLEKIETSLKIYS
ncbi:MAG: outer membrane protein assembly factor BamD [Capnocytophaga felis]|uniref:Outer membrane protein assembly factor BamD n=1 Tax=Capnocytophaga felis TaxID=2267611 RepID=A0A5M4B8V9_9FLAO|nr:outer membrane protein assembly factor BamD [Capnocytophaga felis]MDO4782302.1 outer membrane protein assembly factor BamD [Capnocytophaga felis]GET45695.1 outer membrane protein assembly factor BamD [Capnocytophaga felis]GET47919.1 outer membrane protein assembly factor BamD [Capnocytophaga felis]